MTDADPVVVLTWNINRFRGPDNTGGREAALQKAISIAINSLGPTIVCLQEDDPDADPNWLWNYDRAASCRTNEHLSNSVYVRRGHGVVGRRALALESISGAAGRCGAVTTVGGIRYASLHLSGGRFDDNNADLVDRIGLKDRQAGAVAEVADVVAGDFNGAPGWPAGVTGLDTYAARLSRNFKGFWTAGHDGVTDHGFVAVPFEARQPTSRRVPVPVDYIYYRPSVLINVSPALVLDDFTYSDHYPVITSFVT